MATFKNWIHRLYKLPLHNPNKNKEFSATAKVAEKNGYNKEELTKVYNKVSQKTKTNTHNFRKYIRAVKELFKITNRKLAFRTINTIDNTLSSVSD
jgi:hypothetical protein